MRRKEKGIIFAKCLLLIIGISYLFYDSVFAVFPLSPVLYLLYRDACIKAEQKKREQTEDRFKDVLQSVLTALRAGYSIENAFVEAEKDLGYRFGKTDSMVLELAVINRQVKNSIAIDKLLIQLAEKTGSKDILDFAAVFKIARKSGGDLGKIMERTISIITRRRELKQEIELLVASKKYEQQIMNIVPMGIIFYIRMTNPQFFQPLYGNLFGIVIMTVALALYYFAYQMSERILDIG